MGKQEIYSERVRKVSVGAVSALAPIAIGPIVYNYGHEIITNPFVMSGAIGLGLWGIYSLRKRRFRKIESLEARMETRIKTMLEMDE